MSLLPNSKNRRLSNCMTKKRKCYLTVLTWILREPPMKITFQALVMQMTSCNKCIVQKSGHSLCKRREKILSIFPPKTLAQYVLPLIVLLASKRANTTFIYFKDLVLLATLFSKIVHTFWLFRKWSFSRDLKECHLQQLISLLFWLENKSEKWL